MIIMLNLLNLAIETWIRIDLEDSIAKVRKLAIKREKLIGLMHHPQIKVS